MELIARHKHHSTQLAERLFSHLYAWSANYGASLGRPIVALLALWVLFAAVFWLVSLDPNAFTLRFGASTDPALINALSLSASRILPTGAFDLVSREWFDEFTRSHSDWAVLIVRILASIESAFALGLAFTFGFAVRRKFQIG